MSIRGLVLRHPAIAAFVATVAFIAVMVPVMEGASLPGEWGHALSHLTVAVGAGLFLLSSRAWASPAAGRLGKSGRIAAVVGAGVLVVGQVTEAVGAFGFVGYTRVNALGGLHDVALALGPLGMLTLLMGGVLTLGARLCARTTPVWAMVIAVGGAIAVAGVMMFFIMGGA